MEDHMKRLGSILLQACSLVSLDIDLFPNSECLALPEKTAEVGALLEILYRDGLEQNAFDCDIEDGALDTLYTVVPFLLAEITSNLKTFKDNQFDPKARLLGLKYSMLRWSEFTNRVLSLDIFEPRCLVDQYEKLIKQYSDIDGDDDKVSFTQHEEQRTALLDRRRFEIEAKDAYMRLCGEETIPRLIVDPNSNSCDIEAWHDSINSAIFIELLKNFLKYTFYVALSHMKITKQEIPMLLMMIERGVNPQPAVEEVSQAAPPRAPLIHTILPGGKIIEGVLQKTALIDPSTGENVERIVNRVGMSEDTNLGGRLGRNTVYNDVFKPFYVLPSVSLAEVADWEMSMEVGGNFAKDSKKRVDESGVSYQAKSAFEGNIENAGEVSSEDSDFDDETLYKKRYWEDWKDLNPKGSGNKMKNVG
eukprot:GHVH01006247.1.p1 GENE.GHVH01006247.1~~GHVH01006247.1.p1  ORF type:complete len:419 (+),score=76.82 GHVH01006247.1:127-1383(+)